MGFRVIKTAVATLAAIYTTILLGIDNPLSAGLLAILGVDTTRWRGLRTVFARLMASVLGLMLASLLFLLFGFHIWVLSLFILIAYPLFGRAGLKEGIITGSVVVFHLFASGEVAVHTIGTEIALLLIGFGWATAFNMIYVPWEKKELVELRKQTEEDFSAIFQHLAEHLRNPLQLWSGEQMLHAEAAIEEGEQVAKRAQENRLIPQAEPWMLYFHMRRQQLESIQLMMESVAFISDHVTQAELIAQLFDRLVVDVKSDYYEGQTAVMLDELERSFRRMPLPVNRDEFETRSSLFQIVRELRRYLSIASREKKQKATSSASFIQ